MSVSDSIRKLGGQPEELQATPLAAQWIPIFYCLNIDFKNLWPLFGPLLCSWFGEMLGPIEGCYLNYVIYIDVDKLLIKFIDLFTI